MVKTKATSNRTPAAARESAPQPSRRTAAQSQQPWESRGPSEAVVRGPAGSLQPFWPVFSPELVTIAIADLCSHEESGAKTVAYLTGQFAANRKFGKKQDALIASLGAAETLGDAKGLLQMFAARVFQAAFTVGYYQGRAVTLKATRQGGAL